MRLNACSTYGGGPADAATPGFCIIHLQAAQAQAAKVEFSNQMSTRRPDSFPGRPTQWEGVLSSRVPQRRARRHVRHDVAGFGLAVAGELQHGPHC